MLYKVWGIELKTKSAPNPENLSTMVAEKESRFTIDQALNKNVMSIAGNLLMRLQTGSVSLSGG